MKGQALWMMMCLRLRKYNGIAWGPAPAQSIFAGDADKDLDGTPIFLQSHVLQNPT